MFIPHRVKAWRNLAGGGVAVAARAEEAPAFAWLRVSAVLHDVICTPLMYHATGRPLSSRVHADEHGSKWGSRCSKPMQTPADLTLEVRLSVAAVAYVAGLATPS